VKRDSLCFRPLLTPRSIGNSEKSGLSFFPSFLSFSSSHPLHPHETMSVPYDPPIDKSSRRGRSTSFSASSAPSPSVFNNRTRRQSLSSVPTSDPRKSSLALSDDEAENPSQQPLIDLEDNFRQTFKQDPADAAADRALQREGRQSKIQRLEDYPDYHATGDMEQFMAQVRLLYRLAISYRFDAEQSPVMNSSMISLTPSTHLTTISTR